MISSRIIDYYKKAKFDVKRKSRVFGYNKLRLQWGLIHLSLPGGQSVEADGVLSHSETDKQESETSDRGITRLLQPCWVFISLQGTSGNLDLLELIDLKL